MAQILIGWEMGANQGHALRLARLGRVLRTNGHEVDFAVQRVDSIGEAEAGGSAVWQAPVTPRLLARSRRSLPGLPAGMGDILARLGFDDARLVVAMVRAWRQLFGAARPELVIGDYAPFLLLAARGRIPAIAVGTGFTAPPADMAQFPRLIENPPLTEQSETLAQVNGALHELGDPPLSSLPQLFGCEARIAGTFALLDPYAEQRLEPLASPLAEDFLAAAGRGEEVFVYMPETISAQAPVWTALGEAALPIRVHVAGSPSAITEALAVRGFTVEREPLPFAAIAERSRLLVSHGGHGFVCAGLAAGLPQVVCYPDVEKFVYARALARQGLGGHVGLGAIKPKAFAASLRRIHADDAMAARARAAAPAFRARGEKPLEARVAEIAASLA